MFTNIIDGTKGRSELDELGNYMYWIQVKATQNYAEAKNIMSMQGVYGNWLKENIGDCIYIIEAKDSQEIIGIGVLAVNKELPTEQNKSGQYAVLDKIICSPGENMKTTKENIWAEIIAETTRFLNNNNVKILLSKNKESYNALYDAGYISDGVVGTMGIRLRVPENTDAENGEQRKQKKEHTMQDQAAKIR